jgi:hypothetical protein
MVQQHIKKEKVRLSASKIKTIETCSWLYHSKYNLKYPDTSNAGASRGTICHLIFELLLNDRHKKYFEDLCSGKAGVIKNPPVHRLILKHAKRLDVDDEENLDLIYSMVQTGLQNDFFCSGAVAISPEDHFKLEEDNYIINGFIDKVAKYSENEYKVFDYKSSKAKFSKKEINFNLQNLMYSLAVFKKTGQIPDVAFVFLKYKKQPFQEAPKPTEIELRGFQEYLSYVAGYINNFDETIAQRNLAAQSKAKSWLCGKDVEGKWICPSRKPSVFYKAFNKDGKFIKSGFLKDELKEIEGVESVEAFDYAGCPFYRKQISIFD